MSKFEDALVFPFKNFCSFWNFYWLLIPIAGWFAFMGYMFNVIRALLKGQDKKLIKFGKFGDNFKTGFYFFLYVFTIVLIVMAVDMILVFVFPLLILFIIYVVLVVPIMCMKYIQTGKFKDGFDLVTANRLVFNNFEDYIIVVLKTIAVQLIWTLASVFVITIVITLPALTYTKNYFVADFYRKHVLTKRKARK